MARSLLGKLDLLGALSSLFSFGDSCVGVSIGTSSVKVVELKKSGKSFKLVNFGIAPVPDEAIVNREIINGVAVVGAIRALLGQVKLKSKSVCTGLSGAALMVKRMTVEVKSKKEIQDSVFWEAEQYLPFDASDVVMDFEVIATGEGGQTDVILVACKRSYLESYMSCVSDGGLKPKVVDVDFFALQNAYEANYGQGAGAGEAVALVDLGASAMRFVVVQGGIPVFTKETNIGGRALTGEIQKQLNLSFEEAESLKTGGAAGGMPQEVSDLVRIMAENVAGEIKKSLDFYNASSSGAPVSYILLAGGCSMLQELSRVVEEGVGMPTQLLNPFNSISADPKAFPPDYLASIGAIASVPIGLALRAGAK